MTEEFVQVVTTMESKDDAQKMAKALVEKRLAGCVQIVGPITSTYWWQGEVETADEWLCLIKSSRHSYPQLEATIQAVHPYDTPEILAMPVVAGNPDYLQWLRDELKRD